MATVNQLVRKSRKPKTRKTDVPALKGCPQEEAFVPGFIQLLQKNQILHSEKFAELD